MHQMDCPLAKIQSQFAKGILVGIAVVYGGVNNDGRLTYVGRALVGVISGGVLILVYFLGFLLFPLLMLDVVMRVTIIAAFSPVAIAASLFKVTHRLAEKAVWGLAQAGLTMIFVSIVGGIGKAVLADTFNNLPATVSSSCRHRRRQLMLWRTKPY